MGAGKTVVGQVCAARLGRAWVDTDDLLEQLAGRTIPELWAEGEPTFRRWEREAIDQVAASPVPLVISCGGGAVLDADNRRALRAAGTVVWLRATPQTLAERVGDGSGRPLLAGDPAGTLARLARLREPAYEAAAHVVIDTDGRSTGDVTDAVLAAARIGG
jgi:shikimate kinase